MSNDGLQRIASSIPGLPEGVLGRIESNLDRLNRGNDTDFRTPLYDAAPRDEIIKNLSSVLGSADEEELAQLEERDKSKIGPLSLIPPFSEWRDKVDAYWHQSFHAEESALNEAMSIVQRIVPARSIRPAAWSTVPSLLNPSGNYGLPWLTKDKKYLSWYMEDAKNLQSVEDSWPCMLYTRGQASNLKETKVRPVWGYWHGDTIAGARVLTPMLDSLRRSSGFAGWSTEQAVDKAITRLLDKCGDRRLLSSDYESFDSSVPVEVLNVVDDILAGWLDDEGEQIVRLLGQIANVISLVIPYEVLSGRNGGIPSGQVFTSLRGTIVNLLAGVYAGIRAGSSLEDYEVLGDDSVFLFEQGLEPELFSEFVAELGLTANPSKQWISSTSAHYLQRLHRKIHTIDGICIGVRTPYRALSGMVGQERIDEDLPGIMYSARWLVQAQNCHNHPRFREFVLNFLKPGDKVIGSGMDPVTIIRKAGGAKVVSEALGQGAYVNVVQAQLSSIEDWEITRILREAA